MSKTKITIKKLDLSKYRAALDDLVIKAGNAIVDEAVNNAPTDIGYYKSKIVFDGSNTVIAQANYSAAIEYGFEEYKENVKGHQRVIKKAFGKRLKNPVIVDVKPFQRTMNRKPNPVMRNAAKSVQKEIPQLWKQAQKENGL